MATLNFAAQPKVPYGFEHIEADFEVGSSNTLWVTMARDPAGGRHNFSLPLLSGLHELLSTVKSDDIRWHHQGLLKPVQYAVLKSGHPDFYSLGGDLEHFRACIDKQDKKGLYDYSKLCLDILYEWATTLNNRATTIALVQGRALGGGFETALGADFLIAEEQSEFGFPEIMFGLFPCTGGMSLLARRVGVYEAERMMTNGRIYTAPELKEMGIVDELCAKGEGVTAVEKFIAGHAKRRVARMMLQRSRYRVAPLDYQELLTVVDEWVSTAMELTSDELRVMEMLIRMQQGR
jgi:DSF synthase